MTTATWGDAVATWGDTAFAWDGTAISGSPNTAPVPNAGPDQSVAYNGSTTLDGTASTDDGLPSGTLTYLWSQQSGPATATITDDTAVTTTVNGFTAAGTYVFRLNVSDGSLAASDSMTITVVNNPPVVDAGPDQYIALPDLDVQLAGVVTDDGLPSATVTQLSTKVSGPSTVSFDDATAVNAVATFGAAGAYVLRLTATDTSLTSSDDMRVVITDPSAPATPATDVGHHFGHGHGY